MDDNKNEFDGIEDFEEETLLDAHQVLKSYANQVFEHLNADTVHIFITKYDHAQNLSVACEAGKGDWFSRLGYIKTWLETQEEKNRERARDETYFFMDDDDASNSID